MASMASREEVVFFRHTGIRDYYVAAGYHMGEYIHERIRIKLVADHFYCAAGGFHIQHLGRYRLSQFFIRDVPYFSIFGFVSDGYRISLFEVIDKAFK